MKIILQYSQVITILFLSGMRVYDFSLLYRYDINLNQRIQMFTQEDTRRKTNSTNNVKTVFGSNSHNSLISAMDKKRSDLSKQKVKVAQMPQQGDQFDLKGSAIINFRTIKNNQNNQLTQKPNKDYYQLKIHKKNSVAEQQNGIQINVNIQNMLPHNKKHHLTEAHSDRSLSRKRKEEEKNNKKPKKAARNGTNTSTLDDFECNQELDLKPERKTQKKAMQPLIEKPISGGEKLLNPILKIKNPQISDFQRDIKQFQITSQEVNALRQAQSLCFLDSRQICYEIDSLYIQKKQKNLNWTMRSILMDWMMHISYEFRLKRQTLYIALTLVDNFFQSTTNLAKADFQLTGAAALFIAAKLQQFQPLSSRQFAKSTKQRYSAQQVKVFQSRIVKTLKYNLNPPTINMWANKVMQQWDLFLQRTNILQNDFFVTHLPKYFKKIDEQSYKNYRQMMQILDCAILDIQTVQYKPKTLVCSLIYLVLGKEFEEFSKKKIIGQFPRTSLFFLQESPYNSIFGAFLEQCLGIKMFELLPSVQYMASYFILPLTYERPCLKGEQQNVQIMHLQEYCSYQTYNPNMLSVVRKRFRGIYQ